MARSVVNAVSECASGTRAGSPAWRMLQPLTRSPASLTALFAYSSQGLSPSNPRARR